MLDKRYYNLHPAFLVQYCSNQAVHGGLDLDQSFKDSVRRALLRSRDRWHVDGLLGVHQSVGNPDVGSLGVHFHLLSRLNSPSLRFFVLF